VLQEGFGQQIFEKAYQRRFINFYDVAFFRIKPNPWSNNLKSWRILLGSVYLTISAKG
jgi:hypothetical protein